MSAIYLLIGISIPVAAGFLIAFLYASKHGQFDDDYTPSIRILMDDPKPQDKPTEPITTSNQNEHAH
ncbi:MAG: cbb3-type cytochrome oxidase assembly protein CcoS [Flavobacteriales bacterium]|jgi:cbb3-type cytochrome oxidase maturation protein